jgi:hypothetical protein
MRVAGHDDKVTETNTGAFVPTCSCGWVGHVAMSRGEAWEEHLEHVRPHRRRQIVEASRFAPKFAELVRRRRLS